MPDDSYVLKYLQFLGKFLSVGPPVLFVLNNTGNLHLQNSLIFIRIFKEVMSMYNNPDTLHFSNQATPRWIFLNNGYKTLSVEVKIVIQTLFRLRLR